MKTAQLFAIFGNPVSHSKSPIMHNSAFKGLRYPACYTRYLLEDGAKLREMFFSLRLKGANITVPHKEYAFAACDHLDPFAQKVGAVNTIIEQDEQLYGYNTDAPGFLKAISEFSSIRTVLFLGAGGTARSTSAILREEGYDVTILNRSQERLESFKKEGFACSTFENFEHKNFDLIVNMTSAGLADTQLPAPKEMLERLIASSVACVDVIYGKETPFLKLAKSHNKPTKEGSDMLLYQGILAFELFTGNRFGFDEIKPWMQQALHL